MRQPLAVPRTLRRSALFVVTVVLAPAAVPVVTADTIQCATGWNQEMKDIPQDWINDGYCDCPLDGADEPNTDACSGSRAWPGIQLTVRGSSEEESPPSPSLTFQCPQQPTLKLPLSRVSDGICDCCDGADEAPGVCEDVCEEVLKAEREARAKLEQAFAVGQNKRKHELYAFKKLREEKLKEIEELEQQSETLDPDAITTKMEGLQLGYLMTRMPVSKSIAAASGILAGVTATELRSVIVHACQLAGEMAADDTNTCAALRLAGLEMGMTWPKDNYDDAGSMKAELSDSSSVELATRLFANAANLERSWNLGESGNAKSKNRRRLEEEVIYDDEYHDDFDEHYDDDEYHPEDSLKGDEVYDMQEETKGTLDILSGLEKELVENLYALPFSATRNAFLTRSKETLADIAKVMAATSEETENSEEEGVEEVGEAETQEANATAPPVDPVAYTMLQTNLRRKDAIIVKGLRWGASSLLFFSANSDLAEDQMLQLALFTIFYGSVSSVQLWQILQVALDDFLVPPIVSDDETCASPWAGSCPPKVIQRGSIKIPSNSLLLAAKKICSGQTDAAMEACSAKAVDANGIPTAIPEGFYGYVTPVPRDEKDAVAEIFAPLTALPVYKEGLARFAEEKSKMEKEKKEIAKKISDIWKDIGGRSGDEMGPNGELHSMANQCFDVLAGKYTYEVCVFGEAKQKEGSSNRGTDLGRFTRMERDDETGKRILYWENGLKCWNGPNRSATVHLTCGPENKVLSADEPDTCRYVLEMESYIACDDKFKERMGL